MGHINKILKIYDQTLLMSLSWALIIVSQILEAYLNNLVVASRYNLTAVSTTFENSL